MEANELKNQQLRRLNKVLNNGVIKTIDCISPGYVMLLEDRSTDDGFGDWISLDEVDFIPITEEKLLKCGFERFPWGLVISKLLFKDDLKCNYLELEIGNGLRVKIKYLHQLQNLYFALTGEELIVNI